MLLEAVNIKKSYGERLILTIDNLEIHAHERIGLVGQNGSGKTTLMNILAGVVEPDEGICRRYADFFYIRQFTADSNIELQPYQSGGEKSKTILLSAFDCDKPLLFADEPTNHLDINGIKLLEKKILRYQGTLLIISHDRELLDKVCNRIIEIESGRVTNYRGNYQYYLLNKKRERDWAWLNYQQYQNEKSRLVESLRQKRQKTASISKAPKRMGNSEARLHKRESGEVRKKLARSAKALETRIKRLKTCERPSGEVKVKFHCNPLLQPVAQCLVKCDKLDISFGSLCLLKSSSFIIPKGSRTALVGANGSGKTSLLRLLVAEDDAFTIAPGTKLGYLAQELENLDPDRTVLDTVTSNSIQPESTARNMLACLQIKGTDLKKTVGAVSGGERVKLAMARLLLSSANLLLLDEPSNYLDIGSTDALQQLMLDYPGTILYVSHDRQLIYKAATRIIAISEQQLITLEDGYQQYQEWLDKANKNNDCGQFPIEQLLLKMRGAELAARIASPRKSDDVKLLQQEYDNVMNQIRMSNL